MWRGTTGTDLVLFSFQWGFYLIGVCVADEVVDCW